MLEGLWKELINIPVLAVMFLVKVGWDECAMYKLDHHCGTPKQDQHYVDSVNPYLAI